MRIESQISSRTKEVNSLSQLVSLYKISNQAEGKSQRTYDWYDEMLNGFTSFIEKRGYPDHLSEFNIHNAREFMLHLSQKPKYKDHPYITTQGKGLSIQTVHGYGRSMKAFSTWLFNEGYTTENILKSLKLPKPPKKIMEPLTPDEISIITDAIKKNTYRIS